MRRLTAMCLLAGAIALAFAGPASAGWPPRRGCCCSYVYSPCCYSPCYVQYTYYPCATYTYYPNYCSCVVINPVVDGTIVSSDQITTSSDVATSGDTAASGTASAKTPTSPEDQKWLDEMVKKKLIDLKDADFNSMWAGFSQAERSDFINKMNATIQAEEDKGKEAEKKQEQADKSKEKKPE